MKQSTALLCLALSVSSLLSSRADAAWAIKHGPLLTRFAADVKPDNVLPEYPRPQMVRADWLNLNGIWEYQRGAANDVLPTSKLSREILVPFPVESALSGVMEHHDRLWYRRSFTVPAGWNGKQVLLHFGAVDYETEVFVNGKSVGAHKGGYDPFTLDITSALNGNGPQELIVKVFDPTNDGGQPRGKQSLRPGGIMYTPTSGIWQTVWLEPVAPGGIENLKIVPDVDGAAVKITTATLGGAADAEVKITVKDGNSVVGIVSGKAGTELNVKVANAKLWSPDSPFLYDLTVTLSRGGNEVDNVGSYFGMRKIEVAEVNGVRKMLLNGKFIFQIGPLDQGFWPDGIYTAPTDAAIRNDIQVTKDLGFNFIRKHIKVEPARWYYWTDHIGLMVWQDMPSANSYDDRPTPPVDKAAYEHELTAMVNHLRNVPSIIMWVTFNEGQGQYDTPRLVEMVKQLDPTRLVNQASGGGHEGAGDVFDIHSYPPPGVPRPNARMALACGEYGGIGFRIPEHMWKQEGGGYTNVTTPFDLVDLYSEFTNQLKGFRDNQGLSAAVYTQTTDVETEVNGLLTYDRVPKMDVALIARANRFEIPPPTYTVVVPTSEAESQTWRYSMEQPQGDAWRGKAFDDHAWKEGKGGFGTDSTPGIGKLGTEWKTNDIWLRRTFNPGKLTPEQLEKLPLRVYHDENVQVYINGVLAFEARGFNGHYENVPMRPEARATIKADADNTLAVHCRQTVGGQYVDVGFVGRESGVPR